MTASDVRDILVVSRTLWSLPPAMNTDDSNTPDVYSAHAINEITKKRVHLNSPVIYVWYSHIYGRLGIQRSSTPIAFSFMPLLEIMRVEILLVAVS